MTSTSDPLVGHVLDGRYEITRRLARGGMATVYRATDKRLTRTVAVKVMHEGLGDDNDFAKKFDREARSAAKLSHPNVVSVFDQGLDVGRPYIVMEYVDGCTLRNVISQEAPLDPLRCLELTDRVLSALVAAHDNGLVHRDVKPENILLPRRGQLKVADFGLARAITAQTATATQGLLIGTVSYLPPELVTTGKADTRSDVYSTGVVLFEMLTGSKPHTGETPIQVAYAHVHHDVPPPSSRMKSNWRTSRSAIPPYVDMLVRAATQREPDQRPPDARAMRAMVRQARSALASGVMNDPALTAQFATAFADGEATERVAADSSIPTSPVVVAAAPGASAAASSAQAKSAQAKSALHVSQRVPVAPNRPTGVNSPRPAQPNQGSADHPASPSLLDAYERFDVPHSGPEPAAAIPVVSPAYGSEVSPRRRGARLAIVAMVLVLLFGGAGGGWWWFEGRYVATPNMVAMSESSARESADQAGVATRFESTFSENVPAGAVISTSPGPGEKVLRDDQVQVVVSKGPERFDMPKVVGQKREDAIAAIEQTHLSVGSVTEQYNESSFVGEVLKSSVEPGTKLRRDAVVDLVISKGPRPIAIRDWTNKPAAEAEQALRRLGFKVVVNTENSTTVPEGVVAGQTPAQGNGKRGDTITLTRSLGPVKVDVPPTKGKPVKEATAALEGAGFKVVTQNSPTFLGLGLVADSNPAGAAKAPQGSTITLVVV